MRRYRTGKILALVLGGTLLLSAAAQPAAFPDVVPDSELGRAVAVMTQAGVIAGKDDGRFDPDGLLSRAEFVKVANLIFHYQEPALEGFPDVPESHWAYQHIMAAKQGGYIQGNEAGEFLPEASITREQFCVMVSRINHFQNPLELTFEIQDGVSPWAEEDVRAALACGLLSLDEQGNLRAFDPITRAEMALALAPYAAALTQPLPQVTPTPTAPVVPECGHSAEEWEAVTCIQSFLTRCEKLDKSDETIDRAVTDVLETLMDCLQSALADHEAGAELNRTYLHEMYGGEIQAFRRQYGVLNDKQKASFETILGDNITLYEMSTIMEYFEIDF